MSKSKMRNGAIAALDVGTSKVCCFIAHVDEDDGLRIAGIGFHEARGLRAGAIVDMEAAETSILAAVHHAEQMADETIREVTLSFSSGAPQSRSVAVEVALNGHAIDDADLRRAHAQGHPNGDLGDRKIVHTIPVGYTIDGSRGIRDPRGMFGRTLGVEVHVITAAIGPLRNLLSCVERCHYDLRGVVATPYASGLSALHDDEVQLGATIIDMGAGATTAAVFAEGALLHIDAVPVGGSHVTSDVARGLSTPLSSAERLKILYGSVLDSPEDDQQMIEVPSVTGENGAAYDSAPRSLLNSIIRPRLEETFELIRDRLDAAGVEKSSGRRLVLTGGGAQLPGTAELAGRVFGKQVRIAGPSGVSGLGDAVSGPAFSAAAGIVRRETRGAAEAIAGPPRLGGFVAQGRRAREERQQGAGSMWRWFAESF